MLGTIVNAAAIATGSVIGSTLKRGLREKYKSIMTDAMGLAAVCLGINAAVQAMPDSRYPVLFIVSLALGGVIGTKLDIAGLFNRLVERLPGESDLSQGLSTAVMLFCIGTLSIVGPMQSALLGDNTYLFANATLDFITSIVLASTYGLGIALAAGILFCWQGSIYLLATLIEPLITPPLLTELSLIGGVLILSSGLGILKIKEFKTMNLLPALLVPAVAVPVLMALGF